MLRSTEFAKTAYAASILAALKADKDWGGIPNSVNLTWGKLSTLYRFAQELPARITKAMKG